jgi:hypothetical protein
MLRLGFPWNWVLLVLQIVFYGLAILGNAWENRPVRSVFYLPTFLLNSNLSALKGFFRYISGKQTNRWQRVDRKVTAN